jgi:Flp pilus assembly protein TadG
MARPPCARRARETGSVTMELAILAPVLLLLVFTIVQVALWSYARSLALGAAQEGLVAARVESGTADAGRSEALDFLARTASDSLLDPQVNVRATPREVAVHVSGRALSVLPGVPGLPVRQSAQGPRERYSQP